jgi:hypothetical protein
MLIEQIDGAPQALGGNSELRTKRYHWLKFPTTRKEVPNRAKGGGLRIAGGFCYRCSIAVGVLIAEQPPHR